MTPDQIKKLVALEALPTAHVERMRALARGFISAKHGRDLKIHGMNKNGVAYQIPGGPKGSSTTAAWWEVLIYAQTGEIPR